VTYSRKSVFGDIFSFYRAGKVLPHILTLIFKVSLFICILQPFKGQSWNASDFQNNEDLYNRE